MRPSNAPTSFPPPARAVRARATRDVAMVPRRRSGSRSPASTTGAVPCETAAAAIKQVQVTAYVSERNLRRALMTGSPLQGGRNRLPLYYELLSLKVFRGWPSPPLLTYCPKSDTLRTGRERCLTGPESCRPRRAPLRCWSYLCPASTALTRRSIRSTGWRRLWPNSAACSGAPPPFHRGGASGETTSEVDSSFLMRQSSYSATRRSKRWRQKQRSYETS